MSLKRMNDQIWHFERIMLKDSPEWKKRQKSYSRKILKKVRNKLIRHWKKDEIPNIGYNGYEW